MALLGALSFGLLGKSALQGPSETLTLTPRPPEPGTIPRVRQAVKKKRVKLRPWRGGNTWARQGARETARRRGGADWEAHKSLDRFNRGLAPKE